MDIRELVNEKNIAEKLSDEELVSIGSDVVEGYDTDEASRAGWKENLEEWTKMALQVADKKTFPWPNASNIKFPLLSTAAMQFAARAYPTLVPADGKVVKCRVVGSDPTGEKTRRAIRISKHMSFQVMERWKNGTKRWTGCSLHYQLLVLSSRKRITTPRRRGMFHV